MQAERVLLGSDTIRTEKPKVTCAGRVLMVSDPIRTPATVKGMNS